MKIYIGIMTALLIVALGFGVYIWYKLQTLDTSTDYVIQELQNDAKEIANDLVEDIEEVGGDVADTVIDKVEDAGSDAKDIVIGEESLTDEQKDQFEKFGLNPDAFVITEEMMLCAEKKLGAGRVDEIIGGASPTPLESFSLVGCI